MKSNVVLLLLAILSFSKSLSAQDNLSSEPNFPNGIFFAYGLGNYSVTDEFISTEKYSGTLPYINFGWAKKHSKYVYLFNFKYRNSENIENYNVSMTVTQFSLNQGFLYLLKQKSLFNKDIFLWVGPSTEFFFYISEPEVANYGLSTANLFSIGLNLASAYPISQRFNIEASMEMTAVSFGSRTDEPEQAFKILTLFSGLNSSMTVGARYYLFNQLSMKLSYRFEYSRVSAWDNYVAASDNIIVGLTYSFKNDLK